MTRRPALVAAAVFAAVAAVVYVVLPPGFALFWDNIGQNLPAMLEVHRQLGEGRLPLWNPYMWSGAPLLADPQTEALYPISWLAFAATGPSYARALDLEFVIHLALGGWFLFLYLDALGATRAGAYLGGLVYALNPHFLFVGTGFINWHAAIAWIPAILYGIERARVASRPVRCLAVAAGAFAMQTFAGHPQISAYTVLFVLPYGLVRATDGSTRRRVLTALAGPLTIGGGAALAAVLLFPAYDMWSASQRAAPPQGTFGAISLTWHGLAAAALPGIPVDPALAHNAWTHLGIVVCVLALVGLRSPDALRVYLAVTAAVAIVLCAGENGPLGTFLLTAPVLRLFRGPFKYYLLAVLPIATLAGLGLSDWQQRRPDGLLRWLLLAGLVACVAGVALTLGSPGLAAAFRSSRRWPWQVGVTVAFVVALVVVLRSQRVAATLPALAIAAALATMAVEATMYLQPNGLTIARVFWATPDILPLLRAADAPAGVPGRVIWVGTVGLYHRIATANGYSGFINQRYGDALGWGQHGAWTPWRSALPWLRGPNRLLDVLNVRYLVVPREHGGLLAPIESVTGGSRFRVAGDFGEDRVFENTQRLPRFYLTSHVRTVDDHGAAVDVLSSGDIDPRATAVVETTVPSLDGASPDAGRVELREPPTPGRLHLGTDSDRAALLVVSEAFDAGWRATVDGVPVPVVLANALTQGVAVPAGHHDVVFAYWPQSLVRGAIVSLGALVLLTALVLFPRER